MHTTNRANVAQDNSRPPTPQSIPRYIMHATGFCPSKVMDSQLLGRILSKTTRPTQSAPSMARTSQFKWLDVSVPYDLAWVGMSNVNIDLVSRLVTRELGCSKTHRCIVNFAGYPKKLMKLLRQIQDMGGTYMFTCTNGSIDTLSECVNDCLDAIVSLDDPQRSHGLSKLAMICADLFALVSATDARRISDIASDSPILYFIDSRLVNDVLSMKPDIQAFALASARLEKLAYEKQMYRLSVAFPSYETTKRRL